MKKGYVINRGISGVEIIEVSITGTFTEGNENYYVVSSGSYKVIWSSDGAPRKPPPYLGNKGTFSGSYPKTVRNDIVTDMAAAKQIAQDLLAEIVTDAERSHRACEERLKELKQPVDWDSFPKDEYISPFTGKKA